jgi:glyoxylase-like metal-dependent hydrolase (beta-lactamase superfamily II)
MSAHGGRVVGRRWFLTQGGRGALGIAVLGVAACTGSAEPTGESTGTGSTPSDLTPTDPTATGSTPSGSTSTQDADQMAWSRVNLGFVSAYVLVRGREAAVVDTGVGGSADEIAAVLDKAGPGWAGVRHVVLTHKHPDHAGSLGDVLDAATQATGYVGAEDLAEVESPRRLTTLADGAEVFGLQVHATPGHTAGHLAIFDPDTGVLIAGDALTNMNGLAGSNPQFTEDKAAAVASVRKLAQLAPKTILVGHGEPLTDGASAALTKLAESLT